MVGPGGVAVVEIMPELAPGTDFEVPNEDPHIVRIG